jgi:hypothetical protein
MKQPFIAKLKTGFTAKTTVKIVKIPEETITVSYNAKHDPDPVINCVGLPIRFLKIGKKWYIEYFGSEPMLLEYDLEKPPFPLSFFSSP